MYHSKISTDISTDVEKSSIPADFGENGGLIIAL